jgi:kumamolisin
MQLDIVLPLSDQAGLDSFLSELYDPASPSYRQFLTVAEFTARFGPSQADYDAVVAFAKANGFTVVGGTRDGMEVQVKGPVSAIETAFHVNMRTYQHPTENRVFFAPDREPSVDLNVPLWHISGLDNYSIPQPALRVNEDLSGHSSATTGSGPSASFLGSDMRAAYYAKTAGETGLTGSGQNLGLFEYYGTDLADLNAYFTNVGQTNNVPITLLSTDGTNTGCTYSGSCDDTEQTLDMTQAIGMAPGLASLVMYIGSSDTAIISAMVSHSPLPTTIGCSWGWTPADPTTLDPYFERMAAQGQNFFAASGDFGAWSSSNYPWPAEDAHVVTVGGTDLITAGAGGAWQSETAWVDGGGGISPDKIPIPAWQQLSGVINSSNKGSTTYRNGPDVSANANFSFYVCSDQGHNPYFGGAECGANIFGGTSFAAPMWAGFVALANQQSVANGNSMIGFLNPIIYQIGVGPNYDSDFHDITSGCDEQDLFCAGPGYDLVTGWGSPNGQNLINALAGSSLPQAPAPAITGVTATAGGGTYPNGPPTYVYFVYSVDDSLSTATIHYQFQGFNNNQSGTMTNPGTLSFYYPVNPSPTNASLTFWATAPGYSQSALTPW